MFRKESKRADDMHTMALTEIRRAKKKLEDPTVPEKVKEKIRQMLAKLRGMVQEDQAECLSENGNSLLFGKE